MPGGQPIADAAPSLRSRPVYFISSNTHSLPNLLTGFALRHATELIDYVQRDGASDLQTEWALIQSGQVPSSRENFLYYVLKKYQQTPAGHAFVQAQQDCRRRDAASCASPASTPSMSKPR